MPTWDLGRQVRRYLLLADGVLPGWITGLYAVGSVALGEHVPGRSDVDLIAVVTRRLGRGDAGRLRALHAGAGVVALRASRRGGLTNTSFVCEADLRTPVTRIRPVASHTGLEVTLGAAFDVNPVQWKVLCERGLVFRGPHPRELGLDPEPDRLVAWNRANLQSYWRPWGERVAAGRPFAGLLGRTSYGPPWAVAWGALGASRLHCTIRTGEVIGKRTAGEHALDAFGSAWHPVVRRGLAWWHGEPQPPVAPDELRRVGDFVLHVVDDALR